MTNSQTQAARPLSPFTVIEAAAPDTSDARLLALAMAGRIAADLGATVIRIVPEAGDPLAAMPVLPWEEGREPKALAAFLNAGKSLLALDLGTAEGLRAAEAFAAPAAAILSDGPLADLADGKERVIVRVSAGEDEGADAPAPLSELCLLALSGLLDIVGDPEREPLMLAGHQAGYAAGFAAFSAMTTGLFGLEAHGAGDILDVDIVDTLVWVNWKAVCATEFGGAPVSRQGERAEWRTLQCADGWIALVFEERNWPALVDLVDHPALRDPALARNAARAERRDDYMPHVAAWCAGRTKAEITAAAQSVGLPIGPVVEPKDLAADPQIAARRAIVRVADGAGGESLMPLAPVQWNGAGFEPRPARRLEREGAL